MKAFSTALVALSLVSGVALAKGGKKEAGHCVGPNKEVIATAKSEKDCVAPNTWEAKGHKAAKKADEAVTHSQEAAPAPVEAPKK